MGRAPTLAAVSARERVGFPATPDPLVTVISSAVPVMVRPAAMVVPLPTMIPVRLVRAI
jgi:hypothetical protein